MVSGRESSLCDREETEREMIFSEPPGRVGLDPQGDEFKDLDDDVTGRSPWGLEAPKQDKLSSGTPCSPVRSSFWTRL